MSDARTDAAVGAQMWSMMGLVRVYTKKPGTKPDFNEPVVLSEDRGGVLVENFCKTIHRDLVSQLNYALVWGKSVKVSAADPTLPPSLPPSLARSLARSSSSDTRRGGCSWWRRRRETRGDRAALGAGCRVCGRTERVSERASE